MNKCTDVTLATHCSIPTNLFVTHSLYSWAIWWVWSQETQSILWWSLLVCFLLSTHLSIPSCTERWVKDIGMATSSSLERFCRFVAVFGQMGRSLVSFGFRVFVLRSSVTSSLPLSALSPSSCFQFVCLSVSIRMSIRLRPFVQLSDTTSPFFSRWCSQAFSVLHGFNSSGWYFRGKLLVKCKGDTPFRHFRTERSPVYNRRGRDGQVWMFHFSHTLPFYLSLSRPFPPFVCHFCVSRVAYPGKVVSNLCESVRHVYTTEQKTLARFG